MNKKYALVLVAVFLVATLGGCASSITGPVIRLSAGNQILASNSYQDQAKMAQDALQWERNKTQALTQALQEKERLERIVRNEIPYERCMQALAMCKLTTPPRWDCDNIAAQCVEIKKRK